MQDEIALKPGDVVENGWAGRENPYRRLLYLRKGTIGSGMNKHKTFDFIGFDGKLVKLFEGNANLIRVGHMEEYDNLIAALRSLR